MHTYVMSLISVFYLFIFEVGENEGITIVIIVLKYNDSYHYAPL